MTPLTCQILEHTILAQLFMDNNMFKVKNLTNSGTMNIDRIDSENINNSGSINATIIIATQSFKNLGTVESKLLVFLGSSMENQSKLNAHIVFAPNLSSHIKSSMFHADKLLVTEAGSKLFDPSEYDELIILQDHIDPWTLNDCAAYQDQNQSVFE